MVQHRAAVAERDAIAAVLDYSKQPSFEVGTMGFLMATGSHPYGDEYPLGLPAVCGGEALPAMPESHPAEYRDLMTACVAFDPRDRPSIDEVAARLREMRNKAWVSTTMALMLR
jgi:hypothetical protein